MSVEQVKNWESISALGGKKEFELTFWSKMIWFEAACVLQTRVQK